MSVIDLETLLAPITEETPAGANLEYDVVFTGMERAAQGKPEQQMGESVVEAEEPDWKEVKGLCIELLGRTKDLRVGVYLTRALVHTNGWPGFRDGLLLLRGFLETYWESMHPQLDPEDDNDPTLRVNTLITLFDHDTTLKSLRDAPLVASRSLGRFGLRHVEIANGTIPASAGGNDPPPTTAMIDGAFLEVDLAELQATADAVRESMEIGKAIDAKLTELVGAGQAADFSPLFVEVKAANTILGEQLSRRGVGESPVEEAGSGAEGGAARSLTGEVSTREDVIRALDKICDYYARYEPSSPLPLLLQRAKRLVPKTFLEIIQDLAPTGIAEIKSLGGLDREQ